MTPLNDDDDVEQLTVDYVDSMFGPGSGRRHLRFVASLENAGLREALHRYHGLQADTTHLSREENYLLGMCVLSATGSQATAAMYAKTLLHLGVPKEKILEAAGRLRMWIGGVAAVEATLRIQKAIAEYEKHGVASLEAWFPGGDDHSTGD